jgi:hypothetical protein
MYVTCTSTRFELCMTHIKQIRAHAIKKVISTFRSSPDKTLYFMHHTLNGLLITARLLQSIFN